MPGKAGSESPSTPTGSVAGAVLQLVNIAVGAVLYLPFLRRYERAADERAQDEYRGLLALQREAELAQREVALLDAPGVLGSVARSLAEDVCQAVERDVYKRQSPGSLDSALRVALGTTRSFLTKP